MNIRSIVAVTLPATKTVFYVVTVTFIFAATLWGLKRAEKRKLRPLVEKLEKLEQQLRED